MKWITRVSIFHFASIILSSLLCTLLFLHLQNTKSYMLSVVLISLVNIAIIFSSVMELRQKKKSNNYKTYLLLLTFFCIVSATMGAFIKTINPYIGLLIVNILLFTYKKRFK